MLWDEHPKGWEKLPIDLKFRELQKVYTDKVLSDVFKEAIATIEELQDRIISLVEKDDHLIDY